MLNNETKDLDKLLTMGRTSNVTWGLGYNGGNSKGETQFVKGSTTEDKSLVKPTTAVRNQFRSKPKRLGDPSSEAGEQDAGTVEF